MSFNAAIRTVPCNSYDRIQEVGKPPIGTKLAFGKAFAPKGQKQTASSSKKGRPRRQSDSDPACHRAAYQSDNLKDGLPCPTGLCFSVS